jgi:hypothetical protein
MSAPKSEQLRKAIRAAEDAGQTVYRAILRTDGEIELFLQGAAQIDEFELTSFGKR